MPTAKPPRAEPGTAGPDAARAPGLGPEHEVSLLRIARLLHGRAGFTLVILEFNDSKVRNRVIRALDHGSAGGSIVDAGEVDGNFAALEDHIAQAAEKGIVHLVGAERWPADRSDFWRACNYHRELIAERCRAPLLLWVLRGEARNLALEAPDFWAWRSGVYEFLSRPAPDDLAFPAIRIDRQQAPSAERQHRLDEIDAYLAKQGPLTHRADLNLLLEKGSLLEDLGQLDAALESFRAAEAGFHKSDDRRNEARAQCLIANILDLRGASEEALRMLREEALPVARALDDKSLASAILAKIARILAKRGKLDESLKVFREEALPLVEGSGDPRALAYIQSGLAVTLTSKGDLEEAERILRQDVVPIHEKLGDLRERAAALSRLANILVSKGDCAEGIRILREEVLPVTKTLGDVREQAITQLEIAEILGRMGDFDEAMRTLREESLPKLESLGDLRLRAVTMGKIADILAHRDDLDQALHIHKQEELPVYQRLGDIREQAITEAKIGWILLRQGKKAEAHELFASALGRAEELKIPEADWIRGLLEGLEAPTPSPKDS